MTRSKHYRVAVLLDGWLPEGKQQYSVVGSSQVHVREMTEAMKRLHPVQFTLFFPSRENLFLRSIFLWIAIVRVIQHHRQHPFNLIHAHGYLTALAALIVSKLLHIPVVYTVHGSHLMDLKSRSPFALLERWLLTKLKYDAQISVAASFLKYSNVNRDITVIPNGVNTAEFDAVSVEKAEEPTIIWVGKNSPVKGLWVLRQAIVKIRKRLPSLKARLITGGQLSEKSLIRAYKRAHVFVLPSLAEGQPISLLEAWAAKLPVVVTDVGDNALMVKDGVNGYVVEPNNVAQLTQAIYKVLRARTRNIKMGEAGYNMVKEKYTWERVAQETWNVYRQVLSGRRMSA